MCLFILCKVFHFHYFVFQFAIVPCFMLVMIVKVLRSSGDNSQQICSLSKRAHSTLHPVRNFASFILSTRPLIVKVLKQEVKPLCPSDQRAAESQFKRGKTKVAVNMTKLQSSQSQYKRKVCCLFYIFAWKFTLDMQCTIL